MPESKHLAVRLRAVPTASGKTILRELERERVVAQGIHWMCGEERIAGTARTLRFLPAQPHVRKASLKPAFELIDSLRPGDVLAIDGMGVTHAAVLGDMLATRAREAGAAGVVVDGAIRDLAGMRALGITIHARTTHPASPSECLVPWEVDVPIQLGGVFIAPGDFIVADLDAVMVVPADVAEDVAVRGEAMNLRDEFSAKLLRAGERLAQAYPLPPERQLEFEEFTRSRPG